MTNLELYQSPNRDPHFSVHNESITLANTEQAQVFKTAEKQVMHYLLEHVLKVESPYLFTEEGKIPYSYKYLEATRQDGKTTLLPVDYDGQTTFVQLCAKPYEENIKKTNPFYQTVQEKRILKRSQAEMLGAENFQEMVSAAPDNSFFIWSSPPGNKEDGYWESSITYLAQVKPTNKTNIREVFCWRCINDLSLSQHIDFLNFFELHSQPLQPQAKPEDIILHPQWLTPFEAKQYRIKTINDLINFLYKYDNQTLNMEEAKEQVREIHNLETILAPQIKNLADLLRGGDLTGAKKELDKIEIAALKTFFTHEELAKIAYGQALPENCYLFYQQEQLVAFAWQQRRQQMEEQGTSCPSVSSSSSSSFLSSLENIINKGEGKYTCPDCGMKFDGNNCPHCSYKRVN